MTRFEIREDDIRHNLAAVLRAAAVPVWGVLKYDGYGMGLTRMAALLREGGITRFAVSDAGEAAALREAGFTREDVLLLSPQTEAEELSLALDCGAILSVGSKEYGETVRNAAKRRGASARVQIAVDTGLGRFGFRTEDASEIVSLCREKGMEVEGIYSHFSSAASCERETRRQYARFTALLARLEAENVRPAMAHIANSAALFRHPEMRLDAVRVGSALVGRVAGTAPSETGLRRVGTLVTTVCAVRTVPAGSRIGYGGEVLLRKRTELAVLSAGRRQGIEEARGLLRKRPSELRIAGKTARLLPGGSAGNAIADVTGLGVSLGDEARIDLNPLRLGNDVPKCYL